MNSGSTDVPHGHGEPDPSVSRETASRDAVCGHASAAKSASAPNLPGGQRAERHGGGTGEPRPPSDVSPDSGAPHTGDPEARVSRETAGAALPDSPVPLASLFGDRSGQAEEYARILATVGVERGLLGPREVPRVWERHILNCAAIAPLLPEPGDAEVSVCDVGSGAGLPGLVVAMARPDAHVVLLEPLLRRATFLDETVRLLGLSNVEVLRGRAEEYAGRRGFSVVCARAVAQLDRLARWCLPLVEPGGELLAMKGATAERELVDAERVLHELGADLWQIERMVPCDLDSAAATVVRVRRSARASARSRRRQWRHS